MCPFQLYLCYLFVINCEKKHDCLAWHLKYIIMQETSFLCLHSFFAKLVELQVDATRLLHKIWNILSFTFLMITLSNHLFTVQSILLFIIGKRIWKKKITFCVLLYKISFGMYGHVKNTFGSVSIATSCYITHNLEYCSYTITHYFDPSFAQ